MHYLFAVVIGRNKSEKYKRERDGKNHNSVEMYNVHRMIWDDKKGGSNVPRDTLNKPKGIKEFNVIVHAIQDKPKQKKKSRYMRNGSSVFSTSLVCSYYRKGETEPCRL